MNLGRDGSGDMQADVLGRLELVHGSFHSSLRAESRATQGAHPELHAVRGAQGVARLVKRRRARGSPS
jgi:hypothetical protein